MICSISELSRPPKGVPFALIVRVDFGVFAVFAANGEEDRTAEDKRDMELFAEGK